MALTDSLISWWTLDEASGTRNDSHGTNHLTDNNTVTSATGKKGSAGDFERGNNEYLSRADNASLSTGDIDFTFCAWVQMESRPGSANMYIAHKGDSDPTSEWNLNYRDFDSTNRFAFWIADFGVEVRATSLGAPSTGTWYFIVCWHDATANTINIQVNNGTVNSTATGGTAPTDEATSFRIGNFDGTSAFAWDGLIDEAAFWKRVLTSDERTSLYNSGNGVTYSDISGGAVVAPCVVGGGVGSGTGNVICA